MNILYLSCSPRGAASESHRLARNIIDRLRRHAPEAVVLERALGGGALPHIDGSDATTLAASHDSPTDDTTGTLAVSDALIDELERSDALVIGTPMHNFTVPSALKAWIDHVVRARRTFDVGREGKLGRLRDRPVYIAVSSGGVFSGDRARQPDFLTPYLKVVLAVIGLRNVHFFSVEGSALGAQALTDARACAERALQRHFGRADAVH